jgi:Immunity protein 44
MNETILGDFVCTGKLDWHIQNMLFLNAVNTLEAMLNTQLPIKKYGQGLDRIAFIYIIMKDTRMHPNDKVFFRKRKKLMISLELDFEKAVQADLEELIELEAILYLETIKRYKAWKIKDFDSDLFYEDVRNLFLEKGIIKLENLEKAHEWVRIPI